MNDSIWSKATSQVILTGLTLSVITAVGLLGGIGIYSICSPLSLPLALIIGFIFAGAIEGNVYAKNIRKAIKKLPWLFGEKALRLLIARTLRKQAKKYAGHPHPYQHYLDLKQKILNAKDKKAKKQAKFELKEWENQVSRHVLRAALPALRTQRAPPDYITHKALELLIEAIPAIKKQRWQLRYIALPIALLSGIGFGCFTVLSLLPALTTVLSLTLPVSVALLILGSLAIAYALLMYRIMIHILDHSLHKQYKEWVKWILLRDEHDSPLQYRLQVVGKSIVSTIGFLILVGSALALGGSWQSTIQLGINHFLPTIAIASPYISSLLSCASAITAFLFSISSVIKITQTFQGKSLKQLIVKAYQNLSATYERLTLTENMIQRLNPFRLLCYAIKHAIIAAIFILHLIVCGLTVSLVPNYNTLSEKIINWIGIACGPPAEAITDLPYIGETSTHQHGIIEKIITYSILIPALLPFAMLSTVWHYIFSQFNRLFNQPNQSPPLSLIPCFQYFLKHFQAGHTHCTQTEPQSLPYAASASAFLPSGSGGDSTSILKQRLQRDSASASTLYRSFSILKQQQLENPFIGQKPSRSNPIEILSHRSQPIPDPTSINNSHSPLLIFNIDL